MRNFIVRAITGVLFVAAIVASFMEPVAMVLLFALVTGLSVWEYTGLVNAREGVDVNRLLTTLAGVFLFVAMSGYCGGVVPVSVFVPWLITMVWLFVSELYARNPDPVTTLAYTVMSQVWVALPLSLLSVLTFCLSKSQTFYTPTAALSVFVFLWVSDTGAYLTGSLLGRHKLFPRISPGKSWEGSVGGGVLTCAAAAGVWALTERYGVNDFGLSCVQWVGLGLTVVVFGTWGDLVESLFKRTLGIKDSGNILPGHGGMLDRFDSSLLAIPAAVVYLILI